MVSLKAVASARVTDLIDGHVPRARKQIAELKRLYPASSTRELGQRLIDSKKSMAAMVGGVSGVFGLAALPADLLAMAYFQLTLLTELATLYGKSLKSERSQSDLLDFFGYANGVGPFTRTGPRLLSTLASRALEKGGLKALGRVLPLVAGPVTAYFNNKHIQQVGDEALRQYEGFGKTSEKARSKR